MDPNECFRVILDLLYDGRIEEARERITDLKEWMDKGGFEPNWGSVLRTFGDSTVSR